MLKKTLKTCLVLMICFLSTAFIFGCSDPESKLEVTFGSNNATTFSCKAGEDLATIFAKDASNEIHIKFTAPEKSMLSDLDVVGYEDAIQAGVVFSGFNSKVSGTIEIYYGSFTATVSYTVTE
ncbi:MAG: hypothetical protein ACI4L6_04030 [Candidatus Onthoplasma sp.]